MNKYNEAGFKFFNTMFDGIVGTPSFIMGFARGAKDKVRKPKLTVAYRPNVRKPKLQVVKSKE